MNWEMTETEQNQNGHVNVENVQKSTSKTAHVKFNMAQTEVQNGPTLTRITWTYTAKG